MWKWFGKRKDARRAAQPHAIGNAQSASRDAAIGTTGKVAGTPNRTSSRGTATRSTTERTSRQHDQGLSLARRSRQSEIVDSSHKR